MDHPRIKVVSLIQLPRYLKSTTMKPILLSFPNNLEMIPVAVRSVAAYANLTGFDASDCQQLELIAEEILSHVISNDYMPGQEDTVNLRIETTSSGIKIVVKSTGVPPDLETISLYENMSAGEILDHDADRLGLLLIRKFADTVSYINKGKEGHEIEIEKYLPQNQNLEQPIHPEPEPVTTGEKPQTTYYIRRILPQEAYTISKLAYYAYQLSYVKENIYYPERVRQLNETNEMMSYVAVNNANEEILGHSANIPDKDSDLCEVAVAFVNPAYRGIGCLKDITRLQIDEIRSRGFTGVIGWAVTTHPYSQKSLISHGLHESALFVSNRPQLAFNKIQATASKRESEFVMFTYFSDDTAKTLYIPEKHRIIIEKTYANLGITQRDFVSKGGNRPTEKNEITEIKTDQYGGASIYIRVYGAKTVHSVLQSVKMLCASRIESIYLYLPLECPETITSTNPFEKAGFFFSGIRPGKNKSEWLVLQYLNNQVYPYHELRPGSPFGQELVDYVGAADPNGKMMQKRS